MTPIHLNHPTSSSATTSPILEYKEDHSLQLLTTQTINTPTPPSSSFLNLHAHEHAHTIEPIQALVAKDEKFTFHGEDEINPHGSALWSEQSGHDGNESQNSSNLLGGAGDIIKPNCRESSSSKKYPSNYLSTASDSKMGNSIFPVESKPRVRIVHRFRGDYEGGNYNKNLSSSNVRECSDCHTTTTPLWRSGPQGPKSLCNACGIRQRKARRAMEAAAAARTNNNATVSSFKERELTHESHLLPYKKRGKLLNIDNAAANGTATNFHKSKRVASSLDDDSSSSASCLSKDSDSKPRAFPPDEEEAAVLLMALSCGLT